MALRVAVATGNWSNPAIWNAGVLPQSGDVVASNNFTVTIDQNINVDLLTNTVQSPVIITPAMTSNTTPSGIVTASAYYGNNPSFLPFNAFARGGNDWLSDGVSGWLAYQFSIGRVVDKYQVVAPSNGSPSSVPRNWTFEAWNGSAWIILDTVTGNSGTATVTRSIINTTAYIQYRINITANNGNGSYSGIAELYLYESYDYGANSVAGGGFILNSGVTVTCTNTTYGLLSSSSQVTLLTYSGSGIATVNASIAISPSNNPSFPTLLFTGSGTLNINGTMKGFSSQPGGGGGLRTLALNGSGIVNIVGNIETSYIHDAPMITTSNNVTVNHTGDIYTVFAGGNSGRALDVGLSTWTTTGTITGLTRGSVSQVNIASNGRFFHIGTIVAASSGNGVINNSGFAQLNSVMNVGLNNQICLRSDSSSAINLCTGPFICSIYGFVPFQVVRMHLIPNAASYFEFRDETTNGAVSPGPIAPSTRLVSPASVSDGPAIANVRFGTTYALGTLTGTLRMPHPNQVTFGIAVDNTFGNAVLTAASVWDYLVSNITTENSIGMRLKNVSTPQTTGEQLEAFLRLE